MPVARIENQTELGNFRTSTLMAATTQMTPAQLVFMSVKKYSTFLGTKEEIRKRRENV